MVFVFYTDELTIDSDEEYHFKQLLLVQDARHVNYNKKQLLSSISGCLRSGHSWKPLASVPLGDNRDRLRMTPKVLMRHLQEVEILV